MKKIFLAAVTALITITLVACNNYENGELLILNWGEYIDPSIVSAYEKEYKVKVRLETFDSNEAALTIMEGSSFDIVVPSEYSLQELINGNKVRKIDWSKIDMKRSDLADGLIQVLDKFEEQTSLDILEYSVPYFWGTVGLLYNAEIEGLAELVETSGWDISHNRDISFAFYDSSRDSFMMALQALGYTNDNFERFNQNSTDPEVLEIAKQYLFDAKGSNTEIKGDAILNDMLTAAFNVAVVYSGDAIYLMDSANVDLGFYVPHQGSNIWTDVMVIPNNARNVDNAYNFINFISQHENALENSLYVGYSSPRQDVINELIQVGGDFHDYKLHYDYRAQENDSVFIYDTATKAFMNKAWTEFWQR